MTYDAKAPVVKWNVDDNDPPIAGRGYTILVDGEEVERVTALDTEQGWVVKHCQGERGAAHPTDPHLDADFPDEVCSVKLEGEVEVLSPEES